MHTSVRRKDALEYHQRGRPGKIEVVASKPLTSQRDLALAYSPGVAEPCREIAADPNAVWKYTVRGNLVAVITNGTAVLGLGNIGPLAAKPVMEGKGVLFKKFADIDVFDLELDASDPDRFIDCVCALEPTFGGINLEDVKSPECFYIEQKLRERLKIPVFHDDQHGTAIISGAALMNAAQLQGKDLADLKVVVSGAGASAIACTRFYCSLGVRKENVLMCDSKGVLHHKRSDIDGIKAEFAIDTDRRTLADALEGADMLLGLSVGGLVDGAMVRKMNVRPIIFALANPDPEILPEAVFEVRDDAIVATGRSDYDNQVNNVLGFPFIFRGALDVRATSITEAMKVAAASALAELARRDVPQSVRNAYGEDFAFGPRYIIPKPLDSRVLLWVAPAVARAAVDSGVAQCEFDEGGYPDRLQAILGPSAALMHKFVRRAAAREPRRIVFPEGDDPRILQACAILVDERVATPVLIGNEDRIRASLQEHETDLDPAKVQIVDPRRDEKANEYAERFYQRRQRKGVDRKLARMYMRDPNHFGMMMVREGRADGIVTGLNFHYPETIRPALQILGLAPGVHRTAGMYLMLYKREILFFGDTTVNLDSGPAVLADVAEMVADAARTYEVEPRVAMLSFSNFGSVKHPRADTVVEAVRLLRNRRPDLEVEGEMQANVAVDYELQRRVFPFSRLSGPANVLIFPNLEAGNIAYKLMRELGGVPAIGPVLLGMSRPVAVLERDCSVDNIVQMTALTVVQSQEFERRSQSFL